MSTTTSTPTGEARRPRQAAASVRILGILVIVAGVVMVLSGLVTWLVVQGELREQNITVAEDAANFAGDQVDGPFTAYAEAEIIEEHALDATGGLTYAELGRDDPLRETAMNASFLRSSLFTSVVSFGVAAMAIGLGIVLALIGGALLAVGRQLQAGPAVATVPVDRR